MKRTRSPAARAWLTVAVLVLGCCAASSSLRSRTTPRPADAHTALWEETIRLAPDGKRSHRVRQRTVLHTEFAIRDLGDPRIVHDAARESLSVHRSVTTMRDGTKVAIAANSVNETTPLSLAAAPAYTDLRETVVTHVGLEIGCTNELEYEVEASGEGPLSAVTPIQRAHTVGEHIVRVIVPDDRELRWQCLGCRARPSETRSGGARTLLFAWRDLEPFNTAESDGHGVAPGQPRLVVSTADSWGTLGNTVLERFVAAARPTKSEQQSAIAQAEELATTRQRIDELWRFVVDEIRTVHWDLADLRFRASDAAEVLERSYGHTLDKAVLLSALLASFDIRSRPVLLSRDALFAREVPTLRQLSEAWVVVDSGDRERWLSTEALLPGDGLAYLAGRSALDLETGMAFEIVAPADAEVANQARLVAPLDVRGVGHTTADMTITQTGTFSSSFAARTDGAAAVAERQVPSGWDTSCEGCYVRIQHLAPAMSAFVVRAVRDAGGNGRVVEVDLPWVTGSQLAGADVHRQSKMTSTALRSHGMESVHLEIRAADSLTRNSDLPTTFFDNSVGKLTGEHESRDGVLVVDTTVAIEKRLLDGDDYLSLRDLVTELHRANGRSILYLREP